MRMAPGEGNHRYSNHGGHKNYVKDAEETVPDSVLLLRAISKLAVKWLAFVLRVLLLVCVLRWTIKTLVHDFGICK